MSASADELEPRETAADRLTDFHGELIEPTFSMVEARLRAASLTAAEALDAGLLSDAEVQLLRRAGHLP